MRSLATTVPSPAMASAAGPESSVAPASPKRGSKLLTCNLGKDFGSVVSVYR